MASNSQKIGHPDIMRRHDNLLPGQGPILESLDRYQLHQLGLVIGV